MDTQETTAHVKESLRTILEIAAEAATWTPQEQWRAWQTLERIKQIAERGLR